MGVFRDYLVAPDDLAKLAEPHLERGDVVRQEVEQDHRAGGIQEGGLYHDSHSHPVFPGVLELLAELSDRSGDGLPGVMLERDRRFPTPAELNRELDAAIGAGGARPSNGR